MLTLCEICTNVDPLGRCLVQPWLTPGCIASDRQKRCRMWRGEPGDILATLNHRLELIRDVRLLQRMLSAATKARDRTEAG